VKDVCSGCGVCAAMCPSGVNAMQYDARAGMFLPGAASDTCAIACGLCDRVCPFWPDGAPTAELSRDLYGAVPGIQRDDVIGYHLATYAGYSPAHRLTSASGGLTTWLLEELLASGQVDGVVCVGPDAQSPTLFSYRLCRSVDEVSACYGSCYQPVHLGSALREVMETEGRYAVVAVPCVARAVRLAMRHSPKLASRVATVVGLVCGQMKSRHFVEYLATRSFGSQEPTRVRFRAKRQGHPASDFAFSFTWNAAGQDTSLELGWSEAIASVWGRRLFALQACDHCDDVFAECADIALMDAWLPQYERDWRGTNLVVVRSAQYAHLLMHEAQRGQVHLEEVRPADVLAAQRGVVHQKRVLNPLRSSGGPALRAAPAGSGIGSVAARLDAWLGRQYRLRTNDAWARHPGDSRRLRLALLPLSMPDAAAALARRVQRLVHRQSRSGNGEGRSGR